MTLAGLRKMPSGTVLWSGTYTSLPHFNPRSGRGPGPASSEFPAHATSLAVVQSRISAVTHARGWHQANRADDVQPFTIGSIALTGPGVSIHSPFRRRIIECPRHRWLAEGLEVFRGDRRADRIAPRIRSARRSRESSTQLWFTYNHILLSFGSGRIDRSSATR